MISEVMEMKMKMVARGRFIELLLPHGRFKRRNSGFLFPERDVGWLPVDRDGPLSRRLRHKRGSDGLLDSPNIGSGNSAISTGILPIY